MRNIFIVLAVSALLCTRGEIRGTRFENSSCVESNLAPSISILFTGDILLDRGVRRVIQQKGMDALFSPSVDAILRHADVVVGNLECPATKRKAPVQKQFVFRAEPEWLPALRRHGFSHLNLCNNHSIDQGREGLLDTRRNVEKAGMTAVGAGRTMDEAAQPILLCRKPRAVWLLTSMPMALENFALLSDQPSVSQEPMESLISRIHQLKKADSTAVVIVSLHWGGEHTLRPVPRQRMEAHRLINAGADALVCHHTHTLQTIETYREKPIYYSIGNFIFDQSKPLNSRACMVRFIVTSNAVKAETLPITISRCVPTLE